MAGRKKKKNRPAPLGKLVAALTVVLIILLLVSWMVDTGALLWQPNLLKASDFAWENGRMKYLSGEAVQGIDVSYYQGDIDWPQVKASGVEFAFVRVGYRSSQDGQIFEDERAQENLTEAAAAGIRVGAYFFSQAISVQEAAREAEFTLELLRDYELQLPVVFDWEPYGEQSRTDGMTRKQLTRCVRAFCDPVKAAGYDTMVYFNRDLSERLLNVRSLSEYGVWYAQYDRWPDAPCRIDYWQYTDEGTVPGIQGKVDLNLYFPQQQK